MYSSFQLAKKFLNYYVHAGNGKGHGIHSPFVFDFIKNVLNDKKKYPVYKKIEAARSVLLQDSRKIEVEDFGAGSGKIKSRQRAVNKIAASSLKSKKYAQLLYRMVKYYQPQNIVELGTSFGITTAYLAAEKDTKLYTLEGAPSIAAIASDGFSRLGLTNIEMITGPFDETLEKLLQRIPAPGLAFIDGNHRRDPTLQYFKQLLARSTSSTILIFDDIHWSAEMEAAWETIKEDPSVTMTIDLFFIGIVLLRKEFKVKQHFLIRF